ncbi:MAG: TolC family protein, partial [Amphiplicatus sp.]
MRFRTALLAAVSLSVAACASVTPPVAEITALPSSFEYADPSIKGAVPEKEWWRAFGDPSLDALIVEALAANQDIAGGLARVRQARASVKSANASLFPSVSGGVSTGADSTDDFSSWSSSGR